MKTLIGVALACVASVLFNGAVVLQARESRTVPLEQGLRLSLLGSLLRRRRWLVGIALQVLGVGLQTGALLLAPLTAVQPAEAAGLVFLLFVLTLLALFTLAPMYVMISSSVKPLQDVQSTFTWIPTTFTIRPFIDIWKTVPLADYFVNSVIVSGAAMLCSVVVAIFAAGRPDWALIPPGFKVFERMP